MNVEEYEKMYALEDTYWWFQGKKHIVFSLLERNRAFREKGETLAATPLAVDVGCGTGLPLAHLHNYATPIGLDLSPVSMRYCRKRGIQALARCEATRLPLQTNCAGVVLALDLLEHIEDDRAAYAEIARVLRPGGQAIITVPAHPFLWSEHDEALHHHRRYTRQTFLSLLRGQPLLIERVTYAITFTFLPIALYRLVTRPFRRGVAPKSHVIVLPQWLNGLLIALLKTEAWLLKYANLPFGVSLIALVKKVDSG